MGIFNPYTAEPVETELVPHPPMPEYVVPTMGSYTAPSLERGDAYADEFGWAPGKLLASPTETPSSQRLGAIRRYDMRPDPGAPSDEAYRRQDADDRSRHSVEDVDANGWSSPAGVAPGDRRWAPNPRSTPPPESRITSRMAPRSYSFTRPFDQHSERQLNGMHFSMADHRREYEAVGTAPVRSARNTYRVEPTPWDTDVVDLPADVDNTIPNGRIRSVEVPLGNRSWRL